MSADHFPITPAERRHPENPEQLCIDPNSTALARVLHWAQVTPDRLFLVEPDPLHASDATRTYAEFARDLRRWCAALSERGVQRGDRVASLLPQSIDACLLWLACAALGAVMVPVNRELRGEFLRHVLGDAAPSLIFVRPDNAALLDDVAEIRAVPRVVLARGEDFAKQCEPVASIALPRPADVAVVIYTSGTTGPSKGARVTWAQLACLITRIPAAALSPEDVTYAPWPIFHVTGFSPLVTMAYFGGAVVFREKLSVSHFWDDVRRYRCTIATVAAAIPLLLAQPEQPGEGEHPLRFVFTIGGAMNLEFQRRFGTCLIGAYGSTEAGFPLLNLGVDASSMNVAGWLRGGYRARLVDEHGNDVPAGAPGELWIKPPAPAMIFAGYINRPEATAAAMNDGWYRTGDLLAQQDDGAFRFVDRMRDTIRRFGENISSTALEYAVAADEAVLECAAFGLASLVCGQEVVLVVRSQVQAFDASTFYARLVEILPKHMLPSYILQVGEFPKTPTNKILKNKLADSFDRARAWRSPMAIRD